MISSSGSAPGAASTGAEFCRWEGEGAVGVVLADLVEWVADSGGLSGPALRKL